MLCVRFSRKQHNESRISKFSNECVHLKQQVPNGVSRGLHKNNSWKKKKSWKSKKWGKKNRKKKKCGIKRRMDTFNCSGRRDKKKKKKKKKTKKKW